MVTDANTPEADKKTKPSFWYGWAGSQQADAQPIAPEVLSKRRAALEALRKLQQIDRRYAGADIPQVK